MTRLQRLVVVRQTVRQLIDSGEGRRLRRAANVSLGEIASEVGVTLQTIQKWETGQKYPNDLHAMKYTRVLERLAELTGASA